MACFRGRWVDLKGDPGREPVLVFDDVAFSYPERLDAPALEGMRLAVSEGEFIALAGLNGSGKSTLCHLINALIIPTRGRVISCGLDTSIAENVPEIRRSVGLIMQNPDNQIVGPTVEDDVAFGPENLGLSRPQMEERVNEALEAMGLEGLRQHEPHLLSVGEKKRLAVAGALAMRPRILVSDESTSMLDPPSRSETMDIFNDLRKRGITIIHATHRPEEIMLSDRVALLDGGHLIFDGTPEELFDDHELVSAKGLPVPPLFRLALELGKMGYAVPSRPRDARELVDYLWASN